MLERRFNSLGLSGRSHVAFVLGGPLGLSREVLARTDTLISFGPITLPHALARVVLLEQLYRAAKINRGERYHY
jgi:23S rRNA (pseudouridine1915-N3)-methyltransferase